MIQNFSSQLPKKLRLLSSVSVHFSVKSGVAHTIGSSPQNLIDVSTGELFAKMTEKYPENTCMNSFSQEVSMTYERAFEVSLSLATGLVKELKLKPKDRIGVYSYNKWEWHIIQLAAAMADLILVNINPAYQSEELAFTMQKVELKVLFLSDNFKNSNYLSILRKIVPEIQTLQNPLDLKSQKFPHLTALVRFNKQSEREKGFLNFSDLLVPGDTRSLPPHPSCHDPTNIQFTSGTTGLPKAATLSHYNILNNGFQIGNRLNYTNKDNITMPVPFYHCFGMVLASLAALTRGAGITLVCQGFDPKKSLQAASKYKSSSLYGVPTMFSEYLRVLEEEPKGTFDLSSLRTGIVAGSLCPEPLMVKILNQLGLKDITNCYGMTETAPVSFQTSVSDSMKQKTTTVGFILDGCEAKIVDENNNTVKAGEPGQFWTKGWHVMLRYWNDEAATKGAIEDGWMKSGDMGVIDKDGYLSIVGRKKDMIIRGGENVYPKQIEDYLHKMAKEIQDVQVFGVKDEKFGEEIVALIKVRNLSENKMTGKQVLEFCRGNIAHYKVPKYVKFVTSLPLTVTGKPQKFIMRRQFEGEMSKGDVSGYQIR